MSKSCPRKAVLIEEKPKRSGAVKKTAEEKETPQESALQKYFKETRGELRKVTWPTRAESSRLTAIVVAVTLMFAIFLGLLDFLFSSGVNLLINLFQ